MLSVPTRRLGRRVIEEMTLGANLASAWFDIALKSQAASHRPLPVEQEVPTSQGTPAAEPTRKTRFSLDAMYFS